MAASAVLGYPASISSRSRCFLLFLRIQTMAASDALAQRLLDGARGEVDDLGARGQSRAVRVLEVGDGAEDFARSPLYDTACVMPWKRLTAVCFIAMAVATWVTEIQITNDILGGDGAYDNAYALVWVAHIASGVLGFMVAIVLGSFLSPPSNSQQSLKDLIFRPTRDTLSSTFYLSILVNFVSWTWFLSIPLTDAMVNTVIYQSACVWCFLISVVLLGEKVTLIKVVSTLATFAGVGIISNFPCSVLSVPGTKPSPSDPSSANRSLWGDFLCLSSAVIYALYEVLLKVWGAGGHGHSTEFQDTATLSDASRDAASAPGCGIVSRIGDGHFAGTESGDAHEASVRSDSSGEGVEVEGGIRSSVESAVFVGWMGIWNLLVLWVPMAVCHYTGYQLFHLPRQEQVGIILLDCALEGAYLVWIVLAIALSRCSPSHFPAPTPRPWHPPRTRVRAAH